MSPPINSRKKARQRRTSRSARTPPPPSKLNSADPGSFTVSCPTLQPPNRARSACSRNPTRRARRERPIEKVGCIDLGMDIFGSFLIVVHSRCARGAGVRVDAQPLAQQAQGFPVNGADDLEGD